MNSTSNFVIDHIDLTTNNMELTRVFYNKLLVDFLGWDVIYDKPDYFMIGKLPGLRIGFGPCDKEFVKVEFNRYRIGLHHFAIAVASRELIDQIYDQLLKMKAKILDEPKEYLQYNENYYAVYFEDPNGFKMEFVTYQKSVLIS
jgi:catechol 2,3-dioxygenase-like lactoylglutathione lyase family enzyme